MASQFQKIRINESVYQMHKERGAKMRKKEKLDLLLIHRSKQLKAHLSKKVQLRSVSIFYGYIEVCVEFDRKDLEA